MLIVKDKIDNMSKILQHLIATVAKRKQQS